MSDEILRNAAERVCSGIESALGVRVERTLGNAQQAAPPALEKVIGANPVVVRARLASHGLALFFDEPSALALLRAAQAESAPKILDAQALDALAGLLTNALAGVEGVQGTECVRMNKDGAPDLAGYLGDGAAMITVRLAAGPQLEVNAVFAAGIAAQRELSPDGAPLVSEAEMKDILSGFGPENEPESGNGHSFPDNLEMVLGIELTATARLGRVRVPIAEVLNYGPGSIIDVGQIVDEPVELLVNGKLIARGEVVVVDEKFGLRITEIVSTRERIESLR